MRTQFLCSKVFLIALVFLLKPTEGVMGPSTTEGSHKVVERRKHEVLHPEIYTPTETKSTFTEDYFYQVLDHFNYDQSTDANVQWPMRYIYNGSYWGGSSSLSPIFVYPGNEGDVTDFWINSGYIIDHLAPALKAYVVFPEHRFFGKSLPFGEKSLDHEHFVYLTVDQALADIAVFIKHQKDEVLKCPNCPVFVFGGSYGAMLAAWLRMKYPNVIDGAWSSSGPIRSFRGGAPEGSYFQITSWVYGNVSEVPQCAPVMREGLFRLARYGVHPEGKEYEIVNKIFNLCTKLKSNEELTKTHVWLSAAYSYIPIANYPYATRFLNPMPANPVKVVCQAFNGLNVSSSDEEIFPALYKAALVFYNYENATECYDVSDSRGFSTADLNNKGWDVLTCSQVSNPMTSNGIDDIFPPRKFNYDARAKYCMDRFGLQPRYDWNFEEFGGKDPIVDFQGYSNILFMNGGIDPWHGGGVLVNVSDSVVSYLIEGAAHHLDLRAPHPNDPPSVTADLRYEYEDGEVELAMISDYFATEDCRYTLDVTRYKMKKMVFETLRFGFSVVVLSS